MILKVVLQPVSSCSRVARFEESKLKICKRHFLLSIPRALINPVLSVLSFRVSSPLELLFSHFYLLESLLLLPNLQWPAQWCEVLLGYFHTWEERTRSQVSDRAFKQFDEWLIPAWTLFVFPGSGTMSKSCSRLKCWGLWMRNAGIGWGNTVQVISFSAPGGPSSLTLCSLRFRRSSTNSLAEAHSGHIYEQMVFWILVWFLFLSL